MKLWLRKNFGDIRPIDYIVVGPLLIGAIAFPVWQIGRDVWKWLF